MLWLLRAKWRIRLGSLFSSILEKSELFSDEDKTNSILIISLEGAESFHRKLAALNFKNIFLLILSLPFENIQLQLKDAI